MQEYVELSRNRKTMEAIAYSKKHLVSWQDTHLAQIRQLSALLAFPPNTSCGPYKVSLLLQSDTGNSYSFSGCMTSPGGIHLLSPFGWLSTISTHCLRSHHYTLLSMQGLLLSNFPRALTMPPRTWTVPCAMGNQADLRHKALGNSLQKYHIAIEQIRQLFVE